MKKRVEEFMHEKIMNLRDILIEEAIEINGIKVISVEAELPVDAVKTLAFQIRNKINEKLFFVAGCVFDKKP